MPIYEYELTEDECLMCPGRFSVLQGLDDEPIQYCPTCGLPCRKVVSRATIKTKSDLSYEKAAKKGMTTYKRVKKGQWEKIAGEGVDGIVGTEEDVAAVKEEKKSSGKVLDLDSK